jgi:hypothetical protein
MTMCCMSFLPPIIRHHYLHHYRHHYYSLTTHYHHYARPSPTHPCCHHCHHFAITAPTVIAFPSSLPFPGYYGESADPCTSPTIVCASTQQTPYVKAQCLNKVTFRSRCLPTLLSVPSSFFYSFLVTTSFTSLCRGSDRWNDRIGSDGCGRGNPFGTFGTCPFLHLQPVFIASCGRSPCVKRVYTTARE